MFLYCRLYFATRGKNKQYRNSILKFDIAQTSQTSQTSQTNIPFFSLPYIASCGMGEKKNSSNNPNGTPKLPWKEKRGNLPAGTGIIFI